MSPSKILSFIVVMGFILISSVSCSASTFTHSKAEFNDDNSVTLYTEVNEVSAYQVIKKIHDLQDVTPDKPIFLFIDSPGGNVMSGLKIIDAMQASKRPVYTIAVGCAASMAAYIHSYGVKRYMFPRAYLMFHQASLTIDPSQVEHIATRIAMLKSIMFSLDKNVSDRTGMKIEDLHNREANDYWILSQEALDGHFVENVVQIPDYPLVPVKEDK